jgi:acetylornithine deacetylase/succinyl-diaminopimelate desuccinylase-like protein
MRRIGLKNVKLIDTPGNPVVYGDWLDAPGAPTILFYGHYDVQPVDPLELWESPPFEATIRDGEIYARGSADDKGQVFMHFKAIEAHLKQNGKLPVNMKIILEGEEEVGSVNLDDFIRAHKNELQGDVVVISDSAMFARGVPSICYGLRGLVYFQIDLRGSNTDLHSGSFGGAVANPAFVLSQVLAQMKDRGGRIRIPGFYDDVVPLKEEERQAWASRNSWARPATPHSSVPGRVRPSRSTACFRGSPARGRRPCCRPSRWPRSACGWCPTSTPTRSRNSSTRTSRTSLRRRSS